MNRLGLILRQKIFIIIFVLLAVFGGVVIYWYLSRDENTVTDSPSGEPVLAATCDIEAGIEITGDMLEYKEIPANVYSEKFVILKEEILGRKTGSFIAEGEIISVDDIEESNRHEEDYLKFSSYIPAGFRAVSIPVNYYGDVSLLCRGDIIDVISTYYEVESDLLVSKAVLTGKEIILIANKDDSGFDESGLKDQSRTGDIPVLGEMFGENTGGPMKNNHMVITLYLKPDEVERIFLAMESGVLNISICPGSGATGI